MDVKMGEVVKAVGGEWLDAPAADSLLHKVSTDTRTIQKGDLFFALSGVRFDGHDFVKEALEKGAAYFVISNPKQITAEQRRSARFIQAVDTLKAYGDLAKLIRQKFKIPAVAITGSSGKTTVKELVAHALSQKFQVLKNRGTENNLVGVPKTIFQIEKEHEVVVLEMGTSAPGEIDRLASIIGPQIGIITQIGLAHLEGLKSQEGVREEKIKLISHVERGGVVIVNGQDPWLKDLACGVHKLIRVGFAKDSCDLVAEQIWCHETGSSFYVNGQLYETQLLGRHNVLNCLFAIGAGEALGVETATLQKAISSFKPVAGRMVLKQIEGIHFLDDTYNSNPSSFKAALETLKEFKIRERRGVVCGDMLELGGHSEALHREIGALAASMLFDFVIAAGPQCKFLVDEALKRGFEAKKIHHVKDSKEAGKLCREIAAAGDRILVKGSRGMQMEKVFDCFITSSTR